MKSSHPWLPLFLVWAAPLFGLQSDSKHASPSVSNPHLAHATSSSDEASEAETRLLSNVRQLTFQGRRAGEGYFSSDGSKLIFQAERDSENPFFQIYVMNLLSGDTIRISPGYGKTTCAWIHPGGEKVLFASTHEDPQARAKQKGELERRASGNTRRYSWDYDEYYEIYEGSLDGQDLRNLTQAHGYDAEASWSPDGKLIVFASNRSGYTEKLSPRDQAKFQEDKSYLVDLYLMSADGDNVRQLTRSKGYDGGPFFSLDGRRICWRRFSEDGATAEIYTMRLDGLDEKQITRLGAMSWAPYFHPSGDYLIFATNLHGFGNFELYMVEAEGNGDPVRLTYTDGFDSLPVFSPDGNRLIWTSNRTPGKQSQLFAAEWNDHRARQELGLPVPGEPSLDQERELEVVAAVGDTRPEIRAADLRLHIERLASDEMAGRLTGTEGARRATEYVASVFRSIGLEPAGEKGTYFQHFEFTSGVSLGSENHFRVGRDGSSKAEFVVDKDWRPLAFSKSAVFDPAGVVFAGYGIVAPATNGHEAYDSFVHLDVAGKWVMAFRYLPEDISPSLRQHLARHASLRYKAMTVRDKGALGLIVVSGPNSKVKKELVELSFDVSLAGTSMGTVSITDKVAQQLLKGSGKDLKDLQNRLDQGEAMMGFVLPDVELDVRVDIRQEKRVGRNVLARLPAPQSSGEAVVVGAHVDHLGRGLSAASLAREDERAEIHRGADDNASGVSGLLEMVQHLDDLHSRGDLPMKRDLLVAAWSGEELGRLGSNYFVEELAKASHTSRLSPALVAYLNLDMVGRLRKHLILQGVGSSPVWLEEIEKNNVPVELSIVTQNDSYLPTDATSFYLKGVPILSAFTGAHEEYHTPRDAAEMINYRGAEKIVRLMAGLTRSLLVRADGPEYVEMKRPEQARRTSLRAYLGTIPDYAQTDLSGVKLSGVIAGGPAAQAGVQGGDVIVELAGRKIENIYDYTYAIEALKVGVEVEMVVLRGEEHVKLTVTPGSRE